MSKNFMEAIFQGPDNLEIAQKIVNTAVGVSIFIILLTATFSIVGFYKSSSDATLNYLLDPWMLIDVFLMVLFTFYLYKRKLWAPIALVVHQLLGLVVLYIDLGQFPGAIAIFKLVLFVGAIRAIHFINKNTEIINIENA